MLRWPAFVIGSGWLLGVSVWSLQVAAQTDGTAPPADPPPAAPVEPPTPPPAPPAETPPAPPPSEAPPSAPPPTAAPAPAPPPAGAFPLPPAEKKPAPQPAPAPAPGPALKQEPTPAFAPPPAEKNAPPDRHTEGLFDEKPPSEVRHHEPEAEEEDSVDQFKIGPVVGAGIPALLSVGGTVKITRFFGGGVNLGLIPKVQLSYYGDATLSYKHLDFYGRIYPFGGGVFLHGGVGYATVDGTLTKSVALKDFASQFPGLPLTSDVSYDSEGSVKTLMLTALLGYFHTFDIGFSIGLDAGAQIPIAPSQIEFQSKLSGDIPAAVEQEVRKRYLDPNDKEVRDTLEKIGRTTIPTINFRIGWIL